MIFAPDRRWFALLACIRAVSPSGRGPPRRGWEWRAAWRLLLLCVMVVPVPGLPVAPALSLSEADWERLLTGEALLAERSRNTRHADAGVTLLMQAPVERVWSVITSCEMAHAFVAGLRECEVLEERGDYALTRQVVDKGWATPRLDYTFETRRVPYERMEFELVDGNLEMLRGAWTFESTDHGLLVRHDLVLEPAVPVPRWLVRRNILRDLPGMMRCIRALAGGSGSAERASADRNECAGGRKAPAVR